MDRRKQRRDAAYQRFIERELRKQEEENRRNKNIFIFSSVCLLVVALSVLLYNT